MHMIKQTKTSEVGVPVSMGRDEAWAAVWNARDETRSDWNGCEALFASLADYEAWVQQVADLVTVELGLDSEDDLLDLGCGSGRHSAAIAPRVRSILALDYSRPALSIAAKKRALANVRYEWADLNNYDPAMFEGRTKAYAIGSMLYLKSTEHVMNLVAELNKGGCDVMLLDLPDAEMEDARDRAYDRETYSHLHFRERDFLDAYPQSRIVRGRFPEYVNDAVRFSVVVPAS